MLTMDRINCITTLHDVYGLNVNQIKEHTGHHAATIIKYLDRTDWNEPTTKRIRGSKLDPLKPIIDQWLSEDLEAPRKQRHTAKRVYERLQTEYSDQLFVKIRTVERYVKQKKRELTKQRIACSLSLDPMRGEAQVDFGEVYHRTQAGKLVKGYELVFSFPYSNAGLSQYFLAQNQECLLEGMRSIFEAIGGVPKTIRFDNMSSAVAKIEKGDKRLLTPQFQRFVQHYGFRPVFCNPGKGNEKGNVENKVGYTRRNFFVPIPVIGDYQVFNQKLMKRCFDDMERPHHAHDARIRSLFKEDQECLKPLPRTAFKPYRHTVSKTDGYSYVRFENNKYSTHPHLARKAVVIEHRAWTVRILDQDYNLITEHKRRYSKESQPIVNWLEYLPQIEKKPRALKYSPFFKTLPQQWQEYFNTEDGTHSKDMICVLTHAIRTNQLERATETLEQMLELGVNDADSFKSLFRRSESSFTMPSVMYESAPTLPAVKSDMATYSQLMTPSSGR